MSDFEILVGIDWGAANHQAALVDSDGQLLGNRSFRHDGAGLAAMTDWILARTAGAAATIGVAIKVPHGPVVEAMMERGVRRPLAQSEAARPLPGPVLSGRRQGRQPRRPHPG